MIFHPTALPDAYLLEPQRIEDERGFFARTFCVEELRAHGIAFEVAQCNLSFNRRRATVRGMHWQAAPHTEAKIVRCVRGAIHDVIVDLRRDSPTRFAHFGVDLDAENRLALYVPPGFAHGFQTLSDDTEVHYLMSAPYAPGFSRGARWNDPRLSIRWPLPISVISERDQRFPDLEP